MHSVRRRNDQTARISLHHPSMSKSAETKINRAHHSHGATDQSRLQNFRRSRYRLLPSHPVPRFRSTVRFGEAVFRESFRGPQEEKSCLPTSPLTRIVTVAALLIICSRRGNSSRSASDSLKELTMIVLDGHTLTLFSPALRLPFAGRCQSKFLEHDRAVA